MTKISSHDFALSFNQSSHGGEPRVSISKKVAPRAVDRNRIRRMFREALRQIGKNESSIVINVYENLANFKSNQIKEKLEKVLGSVK